MDRQNCLIIGCGGCGGNQLDELLNIDNRYASLFINTNLSEMDILDNYTERNSFYIPNADGTGKNRDIAKKYFIEEQANIVGLLMKFANQPFIFLLASADGGTGSSAIIAFSKIIHTFLPEKKINVIVTMPSLNAGRIAFENALDFWNELIELKTKKIIQSVQFIDNNKNNFSESEINKKAMETFDKSFDIAEGNIDTSDLERAHNCPGYKMILTLNNNYDNIVDAIIEAGEESVFYLPKMNSNVGSIYQCKQMLGNINEVYNQKELSKAVEIFDTSKVNITDEESIIMLSGCKIPKEPIELINEALKEIVERESEFNDCDDEDLFIHRDSKPKEIINNNSSNEENISKKKKTKSKMTKAEFQKLLKNL